MMFTLADAAYTLQPVVPLRAMAGLARVHGRLQHRIAARDQQVVRDNLRDVLGEPVDPRELGQLARRAFEYRQLRGLMLTLMPRLREDQRARLLPLDGTEHLDRALALGSGVILDASHVNSLCNFMALEVLRSRGYDVGVALPTDADPQPPSRYRRLVDRRSGQRSFRERTGAFYAQFNVRPIVQRLREGKGVLLVGDGWHSASFVAVEFLGRSVYLSTGPMSLARSTGAPVVPMFAAGAPPHGLQVRFEEPIVADRGLDVRTDVERMTRRYAAVLERHVRANPACWQHCFEPAALETMARLPETSVTDRYRVGR